MKKRILTALLSLAVFITGIPNMQQVSANEAAPAGTTYYVSTLDGNDNNDGLAEDKAFYSLQKINEKINKGEIEAGDKILLEAGSVFTNSYLHIKNVSGTAEAPIIIDRYGEGADPRIDTNGQGVWYQDYGTTLDSTSHKYQGYVSSSILLYDAEYIEVRNLEITNVPDPELEATYNYLHVMNRTGVAAVAQNAGTVNHIVLDGLNVHDVIGNVYDKHMNNGGIYFTVFKPINEAETGIARYEDVLIQNCMVKDVNRWGIAVGYTAYHGQFNPTYIADETIAKYGSGNVVIRNNYLEEIGGDAITLMYCDRPLIEYNVSQGAAKQINTTDYSETGSGRVAAGIWPWKCKDAVFQYNECYDMYPNQDGQAWDADSGDGTVYQYNYSHNNAGGAIMFCGGQAANNIFRYNISYNDGVTGSGVINNAGNPDAYLYNNTFYIKEGIDFIRDNMNGGGMVLENNIIYYAGAEPITEEWYKGGNQTKYVYNNNLYYGYTNTPEGDANAITADPKFVDAAAAPTEYSGKSALQGELITYATDSVYDMFKLQEGSPAVNAGVYVANNGGRDFYGNEVTGVPDIGAYDSGTASAQLGSAVYEVDQSEKTITVPKADKVSVRTLKENLEIDKEATVSVTREGVELIAGIRVEDGDVVTVTYNGKSVSYVVRFAVVEDNGEIPVDILGASHGSAESGEEGTKALDGRVDTLWHTAYAGSDMSNRYIVVEVTEDYEISGFKYLPRQAQTNGLITGYEIYVSNDNSTWKKVADGTWDYADRNYKIVTFEPVQARYIKLQATATQGDFASAAEVRVIGEKVYTDMTPPTAPVVTAGEVTKNSAALSWSAATDDTAVVEYELYCGDKKIASFDADVTAYTASALTPGTAYTFRLYALDIAGNKSEAGTIEVTTTAEGQPENPGEGTGGNTNPGEGTGGNTNPGEGTGGNTNPGEGTGGNTNPGEGTGGNTNPGEGTGDNTSKPVPAKKGTKLPYKGATYRVTKSTAKSREVTFIKAKKNTKVVVIPATITVKGITYKVTGIQKNVLKGNKKVTNITIGKNIKTIGANAFYGCTALKKVTLGNAVTTIESKAFYGCSKLTSITIPSKVSKIGTSTFANCKKLKTISMKTTKLTKKGVAKNAFKGVKKSVRIKVPKKKVKAYKTLFRSKGLSTRVKVVKL